MSDTAKSLIVLGILAIVVAMAICEDLHVTKAWVEFQKKWDEAWEEMRKTLR